MSLSCGSLTQDNKLHSRDQDFMSYVKLLGLVLWPSRSQEQEVVFVCMLQSGSADTRMKSLTLGNIANLDLGHM